MKRNTKSITNDLGHTGLDATFGMINDDFLKEWRGPEKVKRIKEMLYNSPIIGALRLAIEMPIRDIDWNFVSDDGEEDPRLELLNNSLDTMSHGWGDHLIEALLSVFYGWSMFTITYERVGSAVHWRKFKMLGHDTIQQWLIEDDGGIAGVKQWPHLWPDPIPIERMILYRLRKTQNNPEGESILRPAWIPWFYVKNIQHVEAIGIERNLAGLPVITPPMGADMSDNSADLNRAELIVRNVRQDEQAGVVLPPPNGSGDENRWHFDLLSAAGASKATDTNIVISRYEKRMLMAALAQFLILGQDNVGALATFQGASDFFTMSVNAIADVIAETFSKYAIPRLMKLNGLNPDGLRIEHSPAGDMDLAVIGTFLQQMGSMITWTPDDEAWLRSIARLPEKSPEELKKLRDESESKRAAQVKAIQQGMAKGQQGNDSGNAGDDGNVDQNMAELFAVDNHPHDDEIRGFEERWQDKALKYFRGQKRRVMKEVR